MSVLKELPERMYPGDQDEGSGSVLEWAGRLTRKWRKADAGCLVDRSNPFDEKPICESCESYG